MADTFPFPTHPGSTSARTERMLDWYAALLTKQWLRWVPLTLVVLLSLVLNAWGLSQAGYGNTYYAAATRSMSESWHNFFFGALDPGGFITVDKPPVFLWVDALSVRIFGYSNWSFLLPSAIAGAISVALLWLIVRRYFGPIAATIAAFVLALTPIWVSVSRLNLPEPFYLLALVGAAYAILRSFEGGRWWAWTAVAGLLVGVAFNTKMLAAWIPGPAFALAIVVATQEPVRLAWRQTLARLAILGVVTLAASASWMLVVDSWPASDRPYIGGSTDNSVQDLVLGYNGFGRVEGEGQGIGGGQRNGGPQNSGPNGVPGQFTRPGANAPGFNPGAAPGQNGNLPGFNGGTGAQQNQGGTVPGFNRGGTTPGGSTIPNNGANGSRAGQAPNGNAAGGQGARTNAGFAGPGGIFGGAADTFRMFDAANGGQIAWFLPFALIGGVFSLGRWFKDAPRRGAIVLFLGWVLLFGGIFSYAHGIYHSYYTSALAPGVAALVGISTVSVGDLVRRNRAWLLTAAGLALVTLWVQLEVSGRFPGFFSELRPVTITVVLVGLALLAAAAYRRLPVMPGLALVIVGLLVLPSAWSGYETANASVNTTLPQAGPRGGAAGRTFGSQAFDGGIAQLATWLQSHADPEARWDLAVSSAQNASTLIAEYNLSVMALGGFSGNDPTLRAADFAELVANGDVRYVLVSGGGPGGARPAAPGQTFGAQNGPPSAASAAPSAAAAPAGAGVVMAAVRSACTAVTDSSLPAQYRGQIFDCLGRADALAAR